MVGQVKTEALEGAMCGARHPAGREKPSLQRLGFWRCDGRGRTAGESMPGLADCAGLYVGGEDCSAAGLVSDGV